MVRRGGVGAGFGGSTAGALPFGVEPVRSDRDHYLVSGRPSAERNPGGGSRTSGGEYRVLCAGRAIAVVAGGGAGRVAHWGFGASPGVLKPAGVDPRKVHISSVS